MHGRKEESSNNAARPIKIVESKTPQRTRGAQLKPAGVLWESTKYLINYWNRTGLRKHGLGTKTAFEIQCKLDLLRTGTLFNQVSVFEEYWDKKFDDAEIYRAIDNFKLAATNPDYDPAEGTYKNRLRRMSFCDFLYSPHSGGGHRSLFLKYLYGPPSLAKKSARPLPDPDPEVTALFENRYRMDQGGGLARGRFSEDRMNDFRRATRLVLDFVKTNAPYLQYCDSPLAFARVVCDAVAWEIDERHSGDWSKVTPGWYCNERFWHNTLLGYLKYQCVVVDPEHDWMWNENDRVYEKDDEDGEG